MPPAPMIPNRTRFGAICPLPPLALVHPTPPGAWFGFRRLTSSVAARAARLGCDAQGSKRTLYRYDGVGFPAVRIETRSLVQRGVNPPPRAGWDILGLGEANRCPLRPAKGDAPMPSPCALPIQLTQRQRELLDHLARCQHSSQQLLRRLQIVCLAADGQTNQEI